LLTSRRKIEPLTRCITAALVSLCLVARAAFAAAPEEKPAARNGKQPALQMLPELHLLEPIWQSPIVYRESTLFVQDAADQPATAKLLFTPDEILEVRLANGSQTLEPNRDFKVDGENRRLIATAETRAPWLKAAELFPAKGASPLSIAHKTGDPDTYVLFENGHWFHDRQVEVTYLHRRDVWLAATPRLAEEQLPKTLARLRTGQPLTIAVSGDSISEGYNASGFSGAPPGMPPYPDLVAAQLEQTFGSPATLRNRAVGGWSVDQGAADLDKLLAEKPDLVIIAYGMNDVGRRDPERFKTQIAGMLRRIEAASSDIEVILVAPMIGNTQWRHTPREMFPQYRDALASLVKPGVALVDLTSIWSELLKRKREVDLTGNGVNHPSDFGHRVYAQAILALFVAPAAPVKAE
jgi:lysophospholipase L1-like esterase